jgi:hypothetical protein
MLTANADEFESDELKYGTAQRRGYLRSPHSSAPGPKPTFFSYAEQDAAGAAAGNHLVLWTDEPRLRAGPYEPWDDEDVRLAIARLSAHPDPQDFLAHIWMDTEPPSPDSTRGLNFRALFLLARQLGIVSRGGVRQRVRALLASAGDTRTDLPDYKPERTFDVALIDSVTESIDIGGRPDGTANAEQAVRLLSAIRVEETKAPITAVEVRALVADLARVLPGGTIDALIRALTDRAHPGPYILPPDLNAPPPSSWEPPPSSREAPPETREKPPPTGWEKPPTTYEDPNARPKPPPPRPKDILLKLPWDAIRYIAVLGTICGPIWTVRYALKGLQAWANAPYGDEYLENLSADTQMNLLEDLNGRGGVPPDFKFPDYSRLGVYWWRAVVKTHCIEHCFALKDTADFHSTDLIRFLMLFGYDDPRIAPEAREAARMSLQYLKYWIDQPAAKRLDGSDRDEMTFWSENHQILFAQSELLAALLLPDRPFPRAGTRNDGSAQTGIDHLAGGMFRTERWLDNRLRFGFAEWNAPGYYNEDLPPLFNLADFCPAPRPALPPEQQAALRRIGVKAAMVLDLIVFDLARFTCRGSFGVTAGRAYWEHKAYGWEQSVGNTIELLFGTRGDYTGTEPAAVALATSTYRVPDALLGIGLDRAYLDREHHFVDRSRVSINFDEAGDHGLGFEKDEDIYFWWGFNAYFTPRTLVGTKRVVGTHANLPTTAPFNLLYTLGEKWGLRFLSDMAASCFDALKVGTFTSIPFPANLVMMLLSGDNVLEDFKALVTELWDAIKTVAEAVEKAILGFLGFDTHNDAPSIPPSTLQKILEALLITFNQGSVLSRANLCTFSDGDTMLSSTQSRSVGMPTAQTHPIEASLGCDACVWTTARFMNTDLGSFVAGAESFLVDAGLIRPDKALVSFFAPIVLTKIDDPFKHDGPNYWTGSLALPMVVQHERAAIAIYDISVDLRKFSGASTHAWFPQAMFDHTDKEDANGGTWFFGRKDTYTPDGSTRTGSGYVALFSALKANWTNDSNPNPWNGKEIQAKGGSNIWVYVVGNEHDFGEFDTFRREVLAAHLNVSGVGSPLGLECSFDIPRTSSPAGRSPRLEAFYGDRRGRFAGEDLALDEFPRFENRYVRQLTTASRGGIGLRPQVETLSSASVVSFDSRAYSFVHPITGMSVEHDLDTPRRTFTEQLGLDSTKAKTQRLVDGSVSPIRAIDPRRQLHAHRQLEHLKAQSRRRLR